MGMILLAAAPVEAAVRQVVLGVASDWVTPTLIVVAVGLAWQSDVFQRAAQAIRRGWQRLQEMQKGLPRFAVFLALSALAHLMALIVIVSMGPVFVKPQPPQSSPSLTVKLIGPEQLIGPERVKTALFVPTAEVVREAQIREAYAFEALVALAVGHKEMVAELRAKLEQLHRLVWLWAFIVWTVCLLSGVWLILRVKASRGKATADTGRPSPTQPESVLHETTPPTGFRQPWHQRLRRWLIEKVSDTFSRIKSVRHFFAAGWLRWGLVSAGAMGLGAGAGWLVFGSFSVSWALGAFVIAGLPLLLTLVLYGLAMVETYQVIMLRAAIASPSASLDEEGNALVQAHRAMTSSFSPSAVLSFSTVRQLWSLARDLHRHRLALKRFAKDLDLRRRRDDLVLAVALLEHGGPLSVGSYVDGLMDNLLGLSFDQKAEQFVGFFHRYNGEILQAAQTLGSQRDDLLSWQRITALEQQFQGWSREFEVDVRSLLATIEPLSSLDERTMRFQNRTRSLASRLLMNLEALRAFLSPRGPEGHEVIRVAEWLDDTTRRGEWLTKEGEDIPVVVSGTSGGLTVVVNSALLHLSLERLIENGRQAIERTWKTLPGVPLTEAQRTVRLTVRPVEVEEEQTSVEITIANPGRIPEEKLAGLFRLDPNRPHFHRGLGLPVAARVIQQMGGRLSVRNTIEPGIPTVEFTVRLPAQPPAEAHTTDEHLPNGGRDRGGMTAALVLAVGLGLMGLGFEGSGWISGLGAGLVLLQKVSDTFSRIKSVRHFLGRVLSLVGKLVVGLAPVVMGLVVALGVQRGFRSPFSGSSRSDDGSGRRGAGGPGGGPGGPSGSRGPGGGGARRGSGPPGPGMSGPPPWIPWWPHRISFRGSHGWRRIVSRAQRLSARLMELLMELSEPWLPWKQPRAPPVYGP